MEETVGKKVLVQKLADGKNSMWASVAGASVE